MILIYTKGSLTMGMQNIRTKKLLYHLTKLDNLDSILENGLVCRQIVKTNNMNFSDVADQGIISKRTLLGLDKFIPFHFHPYSSFDVAVKNTFKEEFIYICIRREFARENNFKILPRHPLSSEEYELFGYDQGFNKIDWEAMHTPGTEDDYIKNVKMAECLTDEIIYANCFHCIYVKSEDTKHLIREKLNQRGIQTPPYIDVQKWF